MGALGNFDHERFCQVLHKRVWSGEKQAVARVGAYRETMYRGANPDDKAIAPNARRLSNQIPIKRRVAELNDHAAKMAGIDSGWALLKLKRLADEIENFNLDDFLSEAAADGSRFFDLSKVPADKLRMLVELTIEDDSVTTRSESEETGEPEEETTRRVRKIKLKGPAKVDMVGPLALMARIAGWEAPKKLAQTDTAGTDLGLAGLVEASIALVNQRREQAAEGKPPGSAA